MNRRAKTPRCIIIAGPNGTGKTMNFEKVYRPLADAWAVYDNSGASPRLMEQGP